MLPENLHNALQASLAQVYLDQMLIAGGQLLPVTRGFVVFLKRRNADSLQGPAVALLPAVILKPSAFLDLLECSGVLSAVDDPLILEEFEAKNLDVLQK